MAFTRLPTSPLNRAGLVEAYAFAKHASTILPASGKEWDATQTPEFRPCSLGRAPNTTNKSLTADMKTRAREAAGEWARPCARFQLAFLNSAMTAVGFEPTPFRNGALSHRLRPLGQTVLSNLVVCIKRRRRGLRSNEEHMRKRARVILSLNDDRTQTPAMEPNQILKGRSWSCERARLHTSPRVAILRF